MKIIRLRSLELCHFKGIKKLEINFRSHEIEIAGRNGSGKTTIFDAFTFLMFGKDSHDRSTFNIKTLNPDGTPMNNVEHTVQGVLEIDGKTVTLKKIYKENWVKKRGELEPELKGHETLCYIDDVPHKISDYQAFISEIVDETVFKQITNPKYFANLPWKKQREILFTMAGTVSDAEIAAGNAEYEALLEKLSGKQMEKYLLQINAEKKKLRTDLDAIPTRIDEVERSKPEAENFTAIEHEISKKKESVEFLDVKISNASNAFSEQSADNQKIYAQINTLKNQQSQILNDANQKKMAVFFEAKNNRKEVEMDLQNAQRDLGRFENDAKYIQKELELKQIDINKLREEFTAVSESQYEAKEGKMICPVWNIACGDPESLRLNAENQNKARETFNKDKVEKLDAFNEKGQRWTEQITEIESRLSETSVKIANTKNEIEVIQNTLANTPEPVEPQKQAGESIPEWADLEAKIKVLESSVKEIQTPDNSALVAEKKELQAEIEELQKKLAKREQIVAAEARKENLLAEQKELSQLISELEKDEFTIANFSKDKITECESRINSRFNYVQFKLFDLQVNGAEVETCEMMVNGVPYSDVNTAASINAGLDVINVLSKFYGVTAPVFIDNRESVSEIIETDAQIVNLVVDRNLETLTVQ